MKLHYFHAYITNSFCIIDLAKSNSDFLISLLYKNNLVNLPNFVNKLQKNNSSFMNSENQRDHFSGIINLLSIDFLISLVISDRFPRQLL